jgi:hypothetical protein
VKKVVKMIPLNYLLWAQQYFRYRYPEIDCDLNILESIGNEFWMLYLLFVEKAIVVSVQNGDDSLNYESYLIARNNCLSQEASNELHSMAINHAFAEFKTWMSQQPVLSMPPPNVSELPPSQQVNDCDLMKWYDEIMNKKE